ncbi:MAG: DUF2971 domain-containing protein [Cyclobacteriaceae bacterium]
MKSEIQFFNTEHLQKSDCLWKFLTIEKFFSLVLNSKFHFTRLDSFNDPLEGVSSELLLLNHTKEALLKTPLFSELSKYHSIDVYPTQTDSLQEQLHKTQKFQFANCWYVSPKDVESIAMWNLYSAMNSVAMNISFENFRHRIERGELSSRITVKSFTLGLVKYVNYSDPKEITELQKTLWQIAFTKDRSYEYEKEFRVIAEIPEYPEIPFKPKEGISLEYQKKFHQKNSQIYSLEVNPKNFLEYEFEIVFHPKMPNWVQKDLALILERFEIPFVTRKSNLEIK